MSRRLELQTLFEEILGSRNVYFQPPPSVRIQYPAIIYSRKSMESKYANNMAYLIHPGYEGVLIDKNPDSPYLEKILKLPCCSYDRHYTKDNLNHDAFTIY